MSLQEEKWFMLLDIMATITDEIHACPWCGSTYYMELWRGNAEAWHYPMIWRDGVLENKDFIRFNVTCHCCECNKDFFYSTKL